MNTFRRLKLIASDWLKYNPVSRFVLSCAVEAIGPFRALGDPNRAAKAVQRKTQAARLRGRDHCSRRLENSISRAITRWSPEGFEWDRFFPGSGRRLVQKSIILKAPRAGGEKGVLFVAFEDQWLRLLRHADMRPLAEDYDLVLSPTWSPPYDLPFLIAYKLWPATLVTIMSNLDDEAVFHRIAPGALTVPLLASSWVHAGIYPTRNSHSKSYDIVMLANFAAYKRHFALFRALSRMRSDVKVLILGRRWGGRTRATLEEEARLFGVGKQVTFAENLPDNEMIAALQSARVSVIMSLGEGSCVAAGESLFADVPVGLIAGANVGSRAFINSRTGRFLRPGHLAEDLEAFIDESSSFRPREWMIANGNDYAASSSILNRSLKELAKREQRPWTADIAPMHWRPYGRFASQTDCEALQKEYAQFEKRYGVGVEGPTWSAFEAVRAGL